MQTTGNLRQKLAAIIAGVEDGSIALHKARAMTKAAAEINQSFHSESRMAAAQLSAGRVVDHCGHMPLGESPLPESKSSAASPSPSWRPACRP
jgi:rhamnogalacturonyl hydrolase YesR